MKIDLTKMYAFAILTNFETDLRTYLIEDVLLIQYGKEWKKGIPSGVLSSAKEKSGGAVFDSPSSFMQYTDFPHLKEIAVYKNNYNKCKPFFGGLRKNEFQSIMDDIYAIRNKVSHHRQTFSIYHMDLLIDYVRNLCRGVKSLEVRNYLDNEQFRYDIELTSATIEDSKPDLINNIPPGDFTIDGGFVGRKKDRRNLKNLLYQDLDRVITIIGSGGVGKTALAIKTAGEIYDDPLCPFSSLVWFSAKESKLVPEGIEELDPEIRGFDDFLIKTLEVLRPDDKEYFSTIDLIEDLAKILQAYLSTHSTLLIIDNLETLMKDIEFVKFIKDIPRPSKVLITSRRGLGEVERRHSLAALETHESITLFRIVARERNIDHCLQLPETEIERLVNQVQCYPLAIKWSLGKVALGRDIEESFMSPLDGSSDIAKFTFEDTFNMLSDSALRCLYAASLFPPDEPPVNAVLKHLVELDTDEFEKAIQQLILTSFLISQSQSLGGTITTAFSILSLTRDYVHQKLSSQSEILSELQERYTRMRLPAESEKKNLATHIGDEGFMQTNTHAELLAVDKVRTAIGLLRSGQSDDALSEFEEAESLAPNMPFVLVEFAKYWFQRRMHTESEKLMKRAVEISPSSPRIWKAWGLMRKIQNKLDDAKAMIHRGLHFSPQDGSLHLELGRVFTFSGNFKNADESLRKALELDDSISDLQKGIALSFLADNFRRWARSEKQNQHNEKALEYYEKALDVIEEAFEWDPSQKTYEIWMHIHSDFGISLLDYGDFQRSKYHLMKSLDSLESRGYSFCAKSGTIAATYFYLVVFERREKQPNYKLVRQYLELGLESAHPRSSIGDKLRRLQRQIDVDKNYYLGRHPRTDAELLKEEKTMSDDALFWYEWALIKIASKEYKEAEKKLDKGLEIAPEHPGLLLERAIQFRGIRDYLRAEEFLRRALNTPNLDDEREKAVLLYELANTLRVWGNREGDQKQYNSAAVLFDEAAESIKQALELYSGYRYRNLWRQIHLDYGICLTNADDLDDAHSELTMSIEHIVVDGVEMRVKKGLEATALFFLAVSENKRVNPNSAFITESLERAKTLCHEESKLFQKIKSFDNRFSASIETEIEDEF